VLVLP
jgi:hypothetical protein